MNGRDDALALRLARGLGWFSIALGAVELLRPRAVKHAAGAPVPDAQVRAYGLREIASGLAILGSRDPTKWVWTRLAGDLLDIASLRRGADPESARQPRAGLALAAVLAITALDLYAAMRRRPRRRHIDYSDRSGFPRLPSKSPLPAESPGSPAGLIGAGDG